MRRTAAELDAVLPLWRVLHAGRPLYLCDGCQPGPAP
jgi:hypothetical protein